MTDIVKAGQDHLKRALLRQMEHCTVSEWLDDDGAPVKIYWRPLTGAEQQSIEAHETNVARNAATLKYRARDVDGNLIYTKTPIESLIHDLDYNVVRAIAFLMATDLPSDFEVAMVELEKESEPTR